MRPKITNRITSLLKENENNELERLYNIVKEEARKERVFLDKKLEQVFGEYVASHKLGEINEQLKRTGTDDVQKVSTN